MEIQITSRRPKRSPCRLHRESEFRDEEEGVVIGEAGEVDVLGKDECHQDDQRQANLWLGERGMTARRRQFAAPHLIEMIAVPVANAREHKDSEQCGRREPKHALLSMGHDNEGCQQGAQRAAEIAAHLEYRLGKSVAPARGQPGNARGFRMKDR
jgi:hypothetical protein